jgi:hypothetical protein
MSDGHPILDPLLDDDRSRYAQPLSDEAFESMFAAVAAETVDSRPTLLRRLQELSTPARIGLGGAFGAGLGGLILLQLGIRGNLRDGGTLVALLLVGLAALGSVSVAVSLRGLHQRPMDQLAWLVSGLTLFTPLALASVPGLWPGDAPAFAMPWAGACFWFGTAVAVPTAAAISLLQRERVPALWRVLTAAGAGGCAGFIVQQLFCPAGGIWHQVSAHGLLGLIASAVVLGVLRLRRA